MYLRSSWGGALSRVPSVLKPSVLKPSVLGLAILGLSVLGMPSCGTDPDGPAIHMSSSGSTLCDMVLADRDPIDPGGSSGTQARTDFWEDTRASSSGFRLTLGYKDQVLEDKRYSRQFFDDHEFERIDVQVPDGTTRWYAVWGGRSCSERCPAAPHDVDVPSCADKAAAPTEE
jgi:hypothetical protein